MYRGPTPKSPSRGDLDYLGRGGARPPSHGGHATPSAPHGPPRPGPTTRPHDSPPRRAQTRAGPGKFHQGGGPGTGVGIPPQNSSPPRRGTKRQPMEHEKPLSPFTPSGARVVFFSLTPHFSAGVGRGSHICIYLSFFSSGFPKKSIFISKGPRGLAFFF